MAEVHSWVCHALPEVPERAPMESEVDLAQFFSFF